MDSNLSKKQVQYNASIPRSVGRIAIKLFWYTNRLFRMSFPEIPWRISEKIKKSIDGKKPFTNIESITPPNNKIFRLSKYTKLSIKFQESIDKLYSFANSAFQNRFDTFGVDVYFERDIKWHLDPITQKEWPQKFWGNINYRDKELGGVKFVWEFNRLYTLFSLGLSYRRTNDQKYADKILWIIHSWNKDNPYPIGVNWASGIEAGVRLANLVWALSFLENYSFSDDDLKSINSFVYFNALRLYRYPSRYSSANNHLLAEGFGLFISGLYFPHLKDADKWFKQGKKIIENEITRQILPDGGSFEFSTTYLSFVFDFFLLFKFCCDTNGIAYNKKLDKRLEKSCEFIKSIMDKNGNIPNMGDQDSAVLVNFGQNNLENFQSILNTGSILFNRDDLATNKPDLKTFLITGKAIKPPIDTDKKNKLSIVLHKNSGLSVIRDWIEGKEILFVGNAMPLGMAPLYAHGHLDALSFTLSVDGKEIFIDPGTYLYHSGGKWREYFRSTAAHNTLRINEKDMSKQTGDFMFGKPYHITRNRLEQKDGKVIWNAGHDAYSKKNPFTDVEREVVWDRNGKEFLITDVVNNKTQAFVELFFHCHPGCKVEMMDGEFTITRGDSEIKLTYDTSLNSEVLYGSHDPVAGWYSPSFNKILKSSTIRLYGNFDNNCIFTTSIRIS